MKLVSLAVKVVVVGLVGTWLVQSHAGSLSLIGILFGALAAIISGWRVGVVVSVACFLVAGVGQVVHGIPLLTVVFVSAVAGLCAYASRFGLHAAALPVVTFASIAALSVPEPGSTWAHAAFVGIGALVGVAVCQIPPAIESTATSIHLTEAGALIYAGIFAGITLAATSVIVTFDVPHGYWLIAAIAACGQPDFKLAQDKSLRRQIGTVVGGLIGLVLVALVSQREAILAMSAVFLLLAIFSLSKEYEYVTGFVAAAIVTLASLSNEASQIASQRILLNVAGGAAVVIIVAAVRPLLERINESVPLIEDVPGITAT